MLSGNWANLPTVIIGTNLTLSFHHYKFNQLCIKSYGPHSHSLWYLSNWLHAKSIEHTLKVAMGTAILDFDRRSRVHALNMDLSHVPCVHCGTHAALLEGECVRMRPRQNSTRIQCKWMGLSMLVGVHCFWAFRVVVFQNSVFIWTSPDSRILDKFPYKIRKIRTGWQLWSMYHNQGMSQNHCLYENQGLNQNHYLHQNKDLFQHQACIRTNAYIRIRQSWWAKQPFSPPLIRHIAESRDTSVSSILSLEMAVANWRIVSSRLPKPPLFSCSWESWRPLVNVTLPSSVLKRELILRICSEEGTQNGRSEWVKWRGSSHKSLYWALWYWLQLYSNLPATVCRNIYTDRIDGFTNRVKPLYDNCCYTMLSYAIRHIHEHGGVGDVTEFSSLLRMRGLRNNFIPVYYCGGTTGHARITITFTNTVCRHLNSAHNSDCRSTGFCRMTKIDAAYW